MSVLRDVLQPGMELVFVGINPGVRSAATGHHYAGTGNHFWPLLFASGLVDEPLTHEQDARASEWGIGLTNMVARPSPGLADLTVAELRSGARSLRRRLLRTRPRLICFNGKRIYEIFAGHACEFGLQPERIGAARVFVMPSTSARGATYQRAAKLTFFRELRAVRDRLRRETVAS